MALRFIPLLALTLLLGGCRQHAQSQQPPPQRVAPEAAGDTGTLITRSRQTAITRAVETVAPAVVSVNVIEVRQVRSPFADDPWFEFFFGRRSPRQQQVQSVGSGFVISPDGYIVTNDHVAGNATKASVSFADGRTVPAQLVGSDPATDIALLKIEVDEPLPYLAFDRSGPALVGEWVIALGNPYGLFEAAQPSVTVGVVSAVGRDLHAEREGRIYREMIQTDAAINQGNSGGPLVNALGEVIGVNTAIISRSGGSVGLGFAVPAAKAERIVRELRDNGFVDRSYYTGFYGVDVDARIARALGLEAARGYFIRDIDPDSPAARAGILPYDVVVAFGGREVANGADLVARLYDFRPGDRVRVVVLREGRRVELEMQIGRQQRQG